METAEQIENLQIQLQEAINLSVTLQDSLIHRSEIGLDTEHLITLAQILTNKLNKINLNSNNLISRIKN